MNDLEKQLHQTIIACRKCPRLVRWRERVARDRPRRYQDEKYWARPLPGFGDPDARLLIVGLAPAAHGGNRTGRIFTGDRSGDSVSYTHLRAHETPEHLVCRLLLEKKKKNKINHNI